MLEPSVVSSSSIASPAPSAYAPLTRSLWILVILIAFGTFFIHLGLHDVLDVNEGQRLLPAREMLSRGDWVVPRIDGAPYVTKPPLVYWIIGGLYQIMGRTTPWVGRCAVALAGVLAALGVAWLGQRTQRGRAGLWGALVFTTAAYTRHKFQSAELDPIMTLTMLGGFTAFWMALQTHGHRWLCWTGMAGVCLAASLMLKGPVVFPFLLAATLAALIVRRAAWRRLLIIWVFFIVLGFLAAAPWCYKLFDRLGQGNLHEGWQQAWMILRKESLNRIGKTTRINSGPIYYYLVQVSCAYLPWSWLVLAWFLKPFRRFRDQVDDCGLFRFTGWFVLFGFIIFSLIAGKETEYLLPLFPFLGLMCGLALDWLTAPVEEAARSWRLARWIFLVLAAAGVLTPLSLCSPLRSWFMAVPSLFVLLGAGVLLAGGCIYTLGVKRWAAPGLMAFVAAFSLLNITFADAQKNYLNQSKSARPLATQLAAIQARQGMIIYHWGFYRRAHDLWYLQPVTPLLPTPEALRATPAVLPANQPFSVLIREKDQKRFFKDYQGLLAPAGDPMLEALDEYVLLPIRRL